MVKAIEHEVREQEMTNANYKITANPTQNKNWANVLDKEGIEVNLSLELENETKVFKGTLDCTGIIRKAK